jgi:hypothetical protein
MYSTRDAGCYLCLFLLGDCAALSQPVLLRLGPFHPTKSSTVEFTVTPAGTVPAASLGALNVRSTQSDSGQSTLLLDLQSFRRSKFNRFVFDIYVNAPNEQQTVPKYAIAEDATGSFCDQDTAVPFHNLSKAGDDIGSISVPLHPSYGSDCLSMKLPDSPLPVELGGPAANEVTITSNFDNLQTTLTAASVRTDCPPCWHSPPAATVSQASLAPQRSGTLTLSLHANTLYTLFAKAMIMKPDKSQDQLYVRVDSVPDQGGTPTSQEFPVPVRFTPPLTALLICIATGAVFGAWLGWLILRITPNASPRSLLSPATYVSVGVAALVWLLAAAAFSMTNTSVVIGGFSLDPGQLVPAFLIATLVAGGTPLINRVKDVWGK